jgi:hypothetical protein
MAKRCKSVHLLIQDKENLSFLVSFSASYNINNITFQYENDTAFREVV